MAYTKTEGGERQPGHPQRTTSGQLGPKRRVLSDWVTTKNAPAVVRVAHLTDVFTLHRNVPWFAYRWAYNSLTGAALFLKSYFSEQAKSKRFLVTLHVVVRQVQHFFLLLFLPCVTENVSHIAYCGAIHGHYVFPLASVKYRQGR